MSNDFRIFAKKERIKFALVMVSLIQQGVYKGIATLNQIKIFFLVFSFVTGNLHCEGKVYVCPEKKTDNFWL